MFYRPETGHGLPHNPFSAIVAPRPIAWVSTRAGGVDNLAPYSFFNAVAYTPPQVMFASTGTKPDRDGTKDTLSQIARSGIFCVNVASASMVDQLNETSRTLPAGQSEFTGNAIASETCNTIDCLRVAGAAASLECRMTAVQRLAGDANWLILGVVTGVHLRDDCVRDGRFDLSHEGWLARLGYNDFTAIHELFERKRPQ